jgi:exopolyphosphatase / guanosine-5'-triphosphate,3'-diphosphate pyrophosphatase
MQKTVAVIDIGSNTIKLLVAKKKDDCSHEIDTLHRRTIEVRIGQGMSAAKLTFSREIIERASAAIATLVEEARPFSPQEVRIVATSAARDAQNSGQLADAIHEKTGVSLEILSGQREAQLVGAAIQLDPTITAESFYVFDLGGGSLECLRFHERQLDQVVSLPLGCVRLAEKLLADPAAVFTPDDERRVAAEVERVLKESSFTFSLPAGSIAVGTGGTLTTALNVMAAEEERKLTDIDPYLSRDDLKTLLALTGALPLQERLLIERLSAGRADVFPTALTVFLKLMELAGQDGIHHSLLNLRYGLAAEMLSG